MLFCCVCLFVFSVNRNKNQLWTHWLYCVTGYGEAASAVQTLLFSATMPDWVKKVTLNNTLEISCYSIVQLITLGVFRNDLSDCFEIFKRLQRGCRSSRRWENESEFECATPPASMYEICKVSAYSRCDNMLQQVCTIFLECRLMPYRTLFRDDRLFFYFFPVVAVRFFLQRQKMKLLN